ncbi:ABATE domain-containing protein [Streptomyces gardneri]|nr:ABATE domain-containing protein [Streptomyces gardneri]
MRDLEPLIGEPLALDLVNTRPLGADLLSTPQQLAAWLVLQNGRLSESLSSPAGEDLAAVRAVREYLTAAVEALLRGERPPAAALRGLEDAREAAPVTRHLDWNGNAVIAIARRAGDPGARVAAELADSAIDLLTDPRISQLKRCAADDCVMLFLPTHPRRQWCSPDRCGNRARVARYYQRQKSRSTRDRDAGGSDQ